MRTALVDFGSNTLRLAVYEVLTTSPIQFVQIVNKKTMAGLAGALDHHHNLTPEGINRAIEILKSYQRKAADLEVNQLHVFATAILRKANNRDEVIALIAKETGLQVHLISGEEEAYLGFVGACYSNNIQSGVQVDIGGGSTELVMFSNQEVKQTVSLPLGSLSLFVEHVRDLMPTPREMDEVDAAVTNLLTNHAHQMQDAQKLFGVGGSVRSTAKICDAWFRSGIRNESAQVTLEEIDEMLHRIAYDPHSSMKQILTVVPERIHTCVTGALALRAILRFANTSKISINKYGVREGYLITKILNLTGK